jgi:hypothetical protein
MRGIFYIDGFNFYFLRMKGLPQFKWLNVKALADRVVAPDVTVERVNYYTANVSGKVDHGAPNRQQTYFRALRTIPEIAIHTGQFLTSQKWAWLIKPPLAKPDAYKWAAPPHPDLVLVQRTEEKGSDVNLGSHLVRDAFLDRFDVAYVVTNDTDLVEPVRIVTEEAGKQVCVVAPCRQRRKNIPIPSPSLAKVCSFVLYIDDADLAASQFPDPIKRLSKNEICKPASWA